MIPGFDDEGFLPPGVHPASVDEIRDRFGGPSEIRRAQMESITKVSRFWTSPWSASRTLTTLSLGFLPSIACHGARV